MKKAFVLLTILLIFGCTQKTQSDLTIINETEVDDSLIESQTVNNSVSVINDYLSGDWTTKPQNAFFGISPVQGEDSLATLVADDASVSNSFLAYEVKEAHQLGMNYGVFISIMSLGDSIDTAPQARAVNLEGEVFSEHEGVDWFVHSTVNDEWINFLKQEIREYIDSGVDVIQLDDEVGLAFFTFTGAEGNIGDFSDENMKGFNDYLANRPELLMDYDINLEEFNYGKFLRSLGYTTESIQQEIRVNHFSDSELTIPLWTEFSYYTLEQTNDLINELVNYGKNYASNKSQKIYFTPFPNDLTSYYILETISELSWDLLNGEIFYFDYAGFPPSGRASGWHKLGYSLMNKPRMVKPPDALREIAPLIEWGGDNLWRLRYIEAFAHRGSINNKYDFDLVDHSTVYHINTSMVNELFSFVKINQKLFDTINIQTLSDTLVIYPVESLKTNRELQLGAFTSTISLLDKIQVQYDVALSTKDIDYADYELIILPHLINEDEFLVNKVLNYVSEGGRVLYFNVAPGVYEDPFNFDEGLNEYGEGTFYYFDKGYDMYNYFNWQTYNEDVIELIGAEDDYQKLDWNTINKTSAEFIEVINELLPNQLFGEAPESIGLQAYETINETIIHMINYDFDLTSDSINEQENIELIINTDQKISSVTMISPDYEGETELSFENTENGLLITVPELKTWDIIICV